MIRRAYLTIDLEDYRQQECRDHYGVPRWPHHAREVRRQVELLLELMACLEARATIFSVASLVRQLPSNLWQRVVADHRVGCHGLEHRRMAARGPGPFLEELRRARAILEDATGEPVLAYRAPYFDTGPDLIRFGAALCEAGFRLDSSLRLSLFGPQLRSLPGSEGQVAEIPFASLGWGPKRLTIIGGSYLRLLPLPVVAWLMRQAERRGYPPMIYLHPYDVDPEASPLPLPRAHLLSRGADGIRRMGRASVRDKLAALSAIYRFEPLPGPQFPPCGPDPSEGVVFPEPEPPRGGLSQS